MTKPVFNDDTGKRAAVLLWVGRVVVAACVILSGAIAFTLTTHIALPGLDGVVTPTLNESRPEIALPTDPGTAHGSDTPNPDAYMPTATARRAKSASTPSLRSTADAVAARRTGESSTTVKPQPGRTSPADQAQRTVKPRNSHAATPGAGSRVVGPTGKKTHPGQAKNRNQ